MHPIRSASNLTASPLPAVRARRSADHQPVVGSAVEDYLFHLNALGRSPATIESYAVSLSWLTRFLKPNAPLETLTAGTLDAAVAAISKLDTKRQPRRSQTTINRYRSAYRAFGRWVFETGRLPNNPAARLRPARVDSTPTPAITPEETQRLLSVIRRSGDAHRLRDEALFSTYAFAGLRRTEALHLRVSDYDPQEQVLRVKDGKGSRMRIVPVAKPLGILLKKLQSQRTDCPYRGEERLFPGRSAGSALTPRQAHTRFERWRAAAGIRPRVTIHSFRAGFATALHRASRDVVLVSRALGHRDLRSTLRYVEPYPGELRRAIEQTFVAKHLRPW